MLTHKGTQPIETSRLILRRARREDAEAMFRNWASDPKVTKYLTWPTYKKLKLPIRFWICGQVNMKNRIIISG